MSIITPFFYISTWGSVTHETWKLGKLGVCRHGHDSVICGTTYGMAIPPVPLGYASYAGVSPGNTLLDYLPVGSLICYMSYTFATYPMDPVVPQCDWSVL